MKLDLFQLHSSVDLINEVIEHGSRIAKARLEAVPEPYDENSHSELLTVDSWSPQWVLRRSHSPIDVGPNADLLNRSSSRAPGPQTTTATTPPALFALDPRWRRQFTDGSGAVRAVSQA
jgi:hypothetical protein